MMAELVPFLFKLQPDLLHHMTTMVHPSILIDKVSAFSPNFFFSLATISLKFGMPLKCSAISICYGSIPDDEQSFDDFFVFLFFFSVFMIMKIVIGPSVCFEVTEFLMIRALEFGS